MKNVISALKQVHTILGWAMTVIAAIFLLLRFVAGEIELSRPALETLGIYSSARARASSAQ